MAFALTSLTGAFAFTVGVCFFMGRIQSERASWLASLAVMALFAVGLMCVAALWRELNPNTVFGSLLGGAAAAGLFRGEYKARSALQRHRPGVRLETTKTIAETAEELNRLKAKLRR